MKTLFSAAVALALAAGVAQAQPGSNENAEHHRGQGAPPRQQAPSQEGGARTGPRGGWNGGQHTEVMQPPGSPRGAQTFVPNYRGQGQAAQIYRGQGQATLGGPRQTYPRENYPGAYRPGIQGGFQRSPERADQHFNRGHFQNGVPNGYQTGGRAEDHSQSRGAYQTGQRNGYDRGERRFRAEDRGRDRYDEERYEHSYPAERRFHIGIYYEPRGWYYRRWGFGDYLPFGWFTTSYYLNAFDYGLPAPPIGAEWVRNGPDAVLVDIWSGEVLSVEYGVFY